MEVKNGDMVKVHYTLKAETGETIESSAGSAPLEFTLGEGKMIPGFEKGVIGMRQGESKTITVPSEEAYGLREERKIFEFSREKAPTVFDPNIGQTVRMHALDGSSFMVTIVDITEKAFIMDANHPLSGKNLVFDLELVEIVSP